jgi:hypothetical protein
LETKFGPFRVRIDCCETSRNTLYFTDLCIAAQSLSHSIPVARSSQVIMNSDIRIQDFLPAYEDDDSTPSTTTNDLLMSVDTGGGYNAGVWLVRNTMWGRGFLNTWWNMKSFVKPPGLSHSGDNDALKALLHSMPLETLQEHVLAPARCTFNSFIKVVAPKFYDQVADNLKEQDFYLAEAYYHKGDFIAHVAGVDNKVDTMKMLLEAAQ